MESGTIVRWLKAGGDRVERDEPLYELDTEKGTQEVESPVAGVLLAILVPEGQEVEVGKPVCVIGEAGEEVPSEAAGADGEAGEAPAPVAEAPPPGPAGLAGRSAAEAVEPAPAAPPGEAKPVPFTAGSEVVPLTSIRRTIARRLSEAWQAPHFAVSVSAGLARGVARR